MWVVIAPDRVGPVYIAIREVLWEHSRIQVHVGKTKVWNSGGMRPVACDMLERIARENNPDNREVRVWRGGGPNRERGISVLGTPLGHPDFVAVHLQKILEEHQILLGPTVVRPPICVGFALSLRFRASQLSIEIGQSWLQSLLRGRQF